MKRYRVKIPHGSAGFFDREGALTALADMKPQDIVFDNSAVNVLITKAVVTDKNDRERFTFSVIFWTVL